MNTLLKCTNSSVIQAAQALLSGDLVAFPTETVYGLGVDALNENAVSRLYSVKNRPKNHPLIVHISSINSLDKWARDIPEFAIQLAENFWPGPMTLVLPRTNLAKNFITGSQDCVGVRVPDQEFTISLLREFESLGGFGVAAPSANRFGKLSPTSASDVVEELGEYLADEDLILDGGICRVGLESTIIDCRQDIPRILRPGVITENMIEEVICSQLASDEVTDNIRVSGLLNAHYSPKAKVFLTGIPTEGEGFIASKGIKTPQGAIRLATPDNNIQFAQLLYSSLRLADKMNLKKVFVVPPTGDGLSAAINDRLTKAAAG